MTDKVQKIREEVENKLEVMQYQVHRKDAYKELKCVLDYIDSLQEEPNDVVDKYLYGKEPELVDEDDLPTKKDYRERYKRIAESEEFRKNHVGMSIGDIVPVEGEDPVSEEWIEELRTKLDSMSKEEFEQVCEKYGVEEEEPASEELETELNKYIKDHFTIDAEQLDRFGIEEKDYMYSMDKSDILALVEHFTKWQKIKSMWHDASEEIPNQGSNILMIRKKEKDTNYPPIAGCFHGTNTRLDGRNWGYYNGFCYNEIEPPIKWAYIDDILSLSNVESLHT